jgi:hypothetical protein
MGNSLIVGSIEATFGLFGRLHSRHLLRDMKNIRLIVDASARTVFSANILRERVRQFVSELMKDANNVDKRALLQHLTIGIARDSRHHVCNETIMEHH